MNSVSQHNFWSVHTHSKYSANDALPSVERIVERAHQLDYPALGLTDHGTPGGSLILYRECRKFGIEPLPGMELYVAQDAGHYNRGDDMHMCVVAYSEKGYRNLCKLATLSAKNFYYKPLVDFADFADMAMHGLTDGLAVTTGCYFGVLPQVLMRRGPAAARQVAETLAGWFPKVYVELQNHGIGEEHHSDLDVTDDELIAGMYDVAQAAGLPCVVTRDSHYVHESEKPLHEALKRLISWSDEPDDAVFPGGGYHMTDEKGLRKYFEPKYLAAGIEGLSDLAEKAYVRLPELESFTTKVPDIAPGKDPQLLFEEKVMTALAKSPLKDDEPTLDQVRMEFDVIRAGGNAPYLLVANQVAEFMRAKSISFHTRGSATGSMCLFLLKVTQFNPIRFKLRFDRFLSHNRKKQPDVDFDIEHTRRDEVVRYVTDLYSVRVVGTMAKYSLTQDEDEESGKGSLRARFYSTMSKKGTPVGTWRSIPKQDRDELMSLADLGLISGYGRHPCGYIIAPDEAVVSELPLAWIASSKKFVTAYDKKGVEELGFLKLDMLGLRNRTAIRITEELTGIDFEDIPDDDPETMKMIGAGLNTGLFQLEGVTQSRGAEQIKPKKVEDIIAIQALFRPATMSSGATDDYRSRRRGRVQIPKRHPDIMKATRETYGVMLYQETVMDILEALGMGPAELEEMLDAVKASNEYSRGALVAIEEMMPRIKELAHIRGWTDHDIGWLTLSLCGYAEYSFGKSHSTSYGMVAYRQGFMKKHHPSEFWTGILTAYANHEKEPGYVNSARRDGVRILPAMVNRSGITYSFEKEMHACRKGFLSVKGIGVVGATELAKKGPYTSLVDLGQKVLPSKVSGAKALALGRCPHECGGIIEALDEAGALRELEV